MRVQLKKQVGSYCRVREMLIDKSSEMLINEIEIDETFIGGK